MQIVAGQLSIYNVEVNSRWLYENHGMVSGGRDKFLRECAFKDLNDLRASDALVFFTDDLTEPLIPSHLGTGARHVEFGIALERGIPIVAVGRPQNVFHFLPHIIHVKDVAELVRFLSPEEIN